VGGTLPQQVEFIFYDILLILCPRVNLRQFLAKIAERTPMIACGVRFVQLGMAGNAPNLRGRAILDDRGSP
jgi:hypothetical protein